MPFENIPIKVDYAAAGLDPAGCGASLDCYTNMHSVSSATDSTALFCAIPA